MALPLDRGSRKCSKGNAAVLLKMYLHVGTNLERITTLGKPFRSPGSRAARSKHVVTAVGKVATPNVEGHLAKVETHVCAEHSIQFLGGAVGLIPINLTLAVHICTHGNALEEAAGGHVETVIEACSKGVLRHKGH